MTGSNSLPRRMADVQLMLTGDVNEAMSSRLIGEVAARVGGGSRSILIAMSTPGGQVYWGVTIYNFLRGLGVEIITHNVGQVDSIGAPIFVAGDRRLTVSQGRFLIHSLSWGFLGQNPSLPEKQIQDVVLSLQRDRDRIAEILSYRTGTSTDVVQKDMLQTRILDAAEAAEYGFVHEISDDVFEPAQEIVNIGP